MAEQITTAEELDALPVGTVVEPLEHAAVWQRVADRPDAWVRVGRTELATPPLPAHVRHRPDAPVTAGAAVTAEQAWGEAADALEQLAADTYPEDVFIKPSRADYEAINALLHRERGHYLDGIAADCYRRALTVGARHLREQAEDRALTALGLTVVDGPTGGRCVMGWLDVPARVFCSVSGGHEFARHGDFLVCDYCGKRVGVTTDDRR